MKKFIFKITCLILSIIAMFSTTSILATGLNTNSATTSSESEKQNNSLELEFVEKNIISLIRFDELPGTGRHHSGFADKTVSNIKQLFDFNGYMYYIVEFEPFGFIIYDNKFTTVLELNATAESPYLNYYDNLIYAGATNYYIQRESQTKNNYLFTHTVLGTDILIDNAEKQILQEKSRKMTKAVEKIVEDTLKHTTTSSRNLTWASLQNYTTITNRSTAGWNTTGNCGWIASALVVWYYRIEKGWSGFAPNGWRYSLVEDIQFTNGDSTWGPDVQEGLDAYSSLNGGGFPNTLPAMCNILPSASSIFNLIDANRPVILLGLITDPRPGGGKKMTHAITVTGVDRIQHSIFDIEWGYWAHFGWGTSYNDHYVNDSALTKGASVYY